MSDQTFGVGVSQRWRLITVKIAISVELCFLMGVCAGVGALSACASVDPGRSIALVAPPGPVLLRAPGAVPSRWLGSRSVQQLPLSTAWTLWLHY